MSMTELVEAFTLERVKSSSAQFDVNKLGNMNGQYMAEMDTGLFTQKTWQVAESQGWTSGIDRNHFARVAKLMQTRMKLFPQVSNWKYFFFDDFEKDEKAIGKLIADRQSVDAIKYVFENLSSSSEFNPDFVQKSIREAEGLNGIPEGKLNQPLRIVLTGQTTGAGIYETAELLGREKTLNRLKYFIV
jgi:glutamyl/glutaminyl-tRNA synthetase